MFPVMAGLDPAIHQNEESFSASTCAGWMAASWAAMTMEPPVPYDPNNVFAKILRGELPCVKVYEDDLTLAFMDIMPSVDGHTLVITREAAENILDLSAQGAAALIKTTQKVTKAVKKGLDCPGVMLVQLNGAAAGQSIPHIHFHILPRSGGIDLKLHGRGMVDAKTLEPIAAKIRAAL